MADSSFVWAKSQPGCWRVNPVHGAEEARLVVHETFNMNSQEGNEMGTSSGFTAEDTKLNC